MGLRQFRMAALALLMLVMLVAGLFSLLLFWPEPLSSVGVRVAVYRGSSTDQVIRQLHQTPLLPVPAVFHLAWLLEGRPVLHAGLYVFHGTVDVAQVLSILRQGRSVPLTVTIIPGTTVRQIYALLRKSPYLDTGSLPPESRLARFVGPLGQAAPNAEGLFLPQSFRYVPGDPALGLLRQSAAMMERELHHFWIRRARGLPLQDPYQVLVLASIVQKEGAPAGEQKRIAAVFLNRLRQGMPLQSDPTVIYALGRHYHGRLAPGDMNMPSAYNTYIHKGLPPAPIAMPGLQAIRAVLHPARNHDLYFIAKGQTYHYSRNYARHVQQIRKYLRALPGERP